MYFHPMKLKVLLTGFFLTVFALTPFAQNAKVDSLRKVLLKTGEDTIRVGVMDELCQKLQLVGNYDSSLICAQSELNLAEKLNYKRGIADALLQISNTYWHKGDYTKSLEYHMQSMDISKAMGYKAGISNNLNSMGIIYEMEGNYPKALDHYLKALAIFREMGNKRGIASVYAALGNIYAEELDYPKSLEYSEKSLAMDRELGNKAGISTNLINLGVTYLSLNQYDKALKNFKEALVIEKEFEDRDAIATITGNIGLVYLNQDSAAKALENYKKALAVSRATGDKDGMGAYLIGIGSAYNEMNDYANAKRNLDSGLMVARSIGVRDVARNAYEQFYIMDKKKGDYKKALEDYTKFVACNDSMVNEANTKKTIQSQMNFEFEQKQATEKADQDKKDALAEHERKKQLIVRNTFIGGFALTLALAFFIFRGYRQKRDANIIISQQKAVVEGKQKEILDSIHYAQRIQKALLASDTMLKKHLPEYFVLYKPKDIVSGDFYWATEKGDAFYLAVCDSTGHGVPGAFMSLLNISFLNEAITEKNIAQPNEVFNHARKRLIENISQEGQQDGMDGVLIRLTAPSPPKGGILLSYSAAYNNPIIIRDKEMIELNADKMAVGASPRQNESFTANTFNLQKGDVMYLFTDGYTDQFGGEKGKKFKYTQLSEKLLAISHQPLAEQKNILDKTFAEWKGSLDQVDDVLVIGVRV